MSVRTRRGRSGSSRVRVYIKAQVKARNRGGHSKVKVWVHQECKRNPGDHLAQTGVLARCRGGVASLGHDGAGWGEVSQVLMLPGQRYKHRIGDSITPAAMSEAVTCLPSFYFKERRERRGSETERLSICWLRPHVPATAGLS